MKKAFAVIGYNNTRINDVNTIKNIACSVYDADIILCKDIITEEDKNLISNTIEVDLLGNSIDPITSYLKNNDFELIGVLPFSDRGVPLGSLLAQHFSLPGDQGGEMAEACIKKSKFRNIESQTELPNWYKKVDYLYTTTREGIESFYEKHKVFFIKPNSEGNSRGCMMISSFEDLTYWLDVFHEYVPQGVLCEELIDGLHEYSYDAVGSYEWITEKKTTDGRFKGEYNHISPAPLSKEMYNRLIEAGRAVKNMIGSVNGANHHEFFINKDYTISCVEPNRRPAGAKVFLFGEQLYDSLESSYEEWMRSLSKVEDNTSKENGSTNLLNENVVGFRWFRADKEMIIPETNFENLSTYIKEKYNTKIIDLFFNVKSGDKITNNIQDNSHFLGHVYAKATSYSELMDMLDDIEKYVVNHLCNVAVSKY